MLLRKTWCCLKDWRLEKQWHETNDVFGAKIVQNEKNDMVYQ